MTTARTSGDVDGSGSSDHGWLGQNHGTASVILFLTDVTPGTVFATCCAWLLLVSKISIPYYFDISLHTVLNAAEPSNLERRCQFAQPARLICQRSSRGRALLDQRRVLLRDLVHLRDREIDLFNTVALLLGRRRDLTD
jgi:hypothetical protein